MTAPIATGSDVSRTGQRSAVGAIGLSLCALLAGAGAFAVTLQLARRPDIAAQLTRFEWDYRTVAWIVCAGLSLGFVGLLLLSRRLTKPARAKSAAQEQPDRAASAGRGAARDAGRSQRATPALPMSGPTVAKPAANEGIAALASSLLSAAGNRGSGFRTLVASDAKSSDCNREAIALAAALSEADKQVMIVDWRTDAAGVSAELGLAGQRGLAELLYSKAAFVDVVRRAPGFRAHVIPPGLQASLDMELLDRERLNLVLDALDQAYDCILVVAGYADARDLFEGLQGRFDAGILFTGAGQSASAPRANEFLGFEVSGIPILHHPAPAGR
jgi:succinoglycan biosynthesis transport protein ExoP